MTCGEITILASLFGALALATVAVLAWAVRPGPADALEDAYLDDLEARRGPPVFTGRAYYDKQEKQR